MKLRYLLFLLLFTYCSKNDDNKPDNNNPPVIINPPVIVDTVTTTYSAAYGTTKRVALPDSTIVMLNADSRITYKGTYKRQISLYGEAFITVSQKGDSVFKVSFDTLSISSTAGEYNINTYELDQREWYVRIGAPFTPPRLAVYQGTVKVSNKLHTVLVESNSYALVDRDSIVLRPWILGEKNKAWTYGEYHYKNAYTGVLLISIARAFNVYIHAPAYLIKPVYFDFDFDVSMPPDSVVAHWAKASGVKVHEYTEAVYDVEPK